MKDLIREIAEDFEYIGEPQGKYDSTLVRGEYNFCSTFMGSDVDIVVVYEDDDCTDIGIYFQANVTHIPEGIHPLISNMLKMFVAEGFLDWREEYNEMKDGNERW